MTTELTDSAWERLGPFLLKLLALAAAVAVAAPVALVLAAPFLA